MEPPDARPNHFIGVKSMVRNGIRKIRATDVVIHDEFLDDAACTRTDIIVGSDLKAGAACCYDLTEEKISLNRK